MEKQQGQTTIKLLAKKGLYPLLLAIPAVCSAGTVSLVYDASRSNNTDAGKAMLTSEMPPYTANEADGSSTTIVNYVGNIDAWGFQMEAALKFTLPATSALLSTAKLHLPVVNVKNSPTATITLTDDNSWQQTDDLNTSIYPSLVNATTLLASQLVGSSGDVALSLDTTPLKAKITSSGTTDVTLIITGSTTADNYFNFVADDDASSNQAYLVLSFKPQVQSVSVPTNGTYKIGDALDFTVTFDSTVVVTGTPRIPVTLNTGGIVYASYVSGSNSKNLVFRYTVSSGELDADGISLGSSISLNSGTIKSANNDAAELNLYSVASTTNILVDGVAPSISGITPPSNGTYIIDQNLDYTVNFSAPVNVVTSGGTPYLTLTLGSTAVHAAYLSGTGSTVLTFRYTAASGDADADGVALASNVTLNGGTVKDAAGNDAALTFTGSTAAGVQVDAVAPTVSSVSAPSAGAYAIGGDLDFTVTASEDVTVTGSPYIAVTVGGVTKHAVYVSGTGTSSLVFRYTLASGDAGTLAAGTSITLDGGTIKDAAGNAMSATSFTAPAISGITIDAVAPSISSATPPSNGTYIIGQDLDYTVTFSEAVDVVTTNGTPYVTLTIGSSAVHAAYLSGTGSTALTFRYTAASGDADADGVALASNVTLNGGTVKDAAGNDAALTFTGSTAAGVLVDAVAPTVSSVSAPSAGTYAIGGDLDFTVTASENVTVTGSPYIAVTVGGVTKHAVYVSGTGTSSLVFRYTLASGDAGTLAAGTSVTLDGGTIKDAAGNALSSTSFTAPTVSGVTIDAVAPAVSSVTPPGNATYIAGQNLDYTVNFSEAVDVVTTNGTPYVTLTIGSSAVHAAYLSGTGSTALTFRYTAASGDADADGVALASNVTLNGGTVKDAAGNDAALTFTGSTAAGVLVDAVAPTVSSVSAPSAGTYAIGGDLDFTVTASENVTVTGSPYIAVTVGGVTKHAVYVSGTGTSSLVFRYTLASGDAGTLAAGTSVTLDGGTIKDAAGNALSSTSFTAPTVSGVTIDAVAPTIAAVTGPSAGTYTSGDTLWFKVAFDEDVTISGTPSIGLTIGSDARQALYVSGSGTDTLKFGYKVESGDEDADGISVDASVSLNDGSIADDAGNAALLDLGTFETEGVIVNNKPTVMVQKNFDPAGYSLRSVSSSGLFHVELPAGVHHAEIILLDATGRRLAAKSLDVSSSSMDVQLLPSARWNLAILRVDGHVKASARGGVPLR